MKPSKADLSKTADVSAAQRTQNFPLAAGFFLFAMFCFISMDAVAKYLTGTIDVMMIVWGRYAAQVLLLAILFGPSMARRLQTRHPRLQVARSLLLLGATFFFFISLESLDISEATAIFFVAPLMVVALAGPLLKERIGPWRWSAVAIGFFGMLLIQQPGTAAFQWASLFPLAASACYAVQQIATRKVSAGDAPTTTLIFTALAGWAVISLIIPFFWDTPDWRQTLAMLAMGALGGIGHFAMILALTRAPASALAPFDYSSLIWAALIGVVVFGETLPAMTLIGAAIIAGAGLFIMWREKRATGIKA